MAPERAMAKCDNIRRDFAAPDVVLFLNKEPLMYTMCSSPAVLARSFRFLRFLFLSCLVALVCLPAPTFADWLVTKEGGRVETKGPWKIQGGIVVFTLPNGTLSSMRLREVDLDKSALLTAETKRAAEEAKKPEAESEAKAPVLVVTNDDVKQAAPPAPGSEDGEEGEGEDVEGGAAGSGDGGGSALGAEISAGFKIVSWQLRNRADIEGFEVIGTLENTSEDVQSRLTAVIRVNTPEGRFVAERRALLGTARLDPAKRTSFSAEFPRTQGAGDVTIFVDLSKR